MPGNSAWILFIYLLVYVAFNSQGHIATGSLQVEETSAYCTVNHQASTSNYQLSNMKRLARDSNRRPQRLERTLTATPLSPLKFCMEINRQGHTSWIYNTLHFTTISNTVAYSDILGDLGLIPSGVPSETS